MLEIAVLVAPLATYGVSQLFLDKQPAAWQTIGVDAVVDALNDSILGEAQADKVVETVDRLDSLADVRELTALLGGRSTK